MSQSREARVPGKSRRWQVSGFHAFWNLFRISDFGFRVFAALLLVSPWLAGAVPTNTPPAPQDPLMALMLSQPKIDVDSPVVPKATFDPPIVRPGEAATYRVMLNALEPAIECSEALKAPTNLVLRAGGRGQVLAMAGAMLEPRMTFNYRVHAAAPGRYIIPEFTVTVYGKKVVIPAAELEVSNDPPPALPPMQQLELDFASTNLFVGEAAHARIRAPGAQGLGQVQMNGKGVIVDQTSARQRIEVASGGPGRPVEQRLTYELTLTPIAAGRLSLFAQGYAIARGFFAGVIMGAPATPGAGPQYLLLDSAPVALNVRPLPREGELPGFTGGVGTFEANAPELSTNTVVVGQPLQLKVQVHGDGNVARLVPPPPPQHLPEWQVLPIAVGNVLPQIIQAQGFTTFEYTLVPLTEKAKRTPAIPFCCFDPRTESYVDLTIPPVEITVLPGATPADFRVVAQANALDSKVEKEPVLSGLAPTSGWTAASLQPVQSQIWFPLMQLAPAAAFAGLWAWDRRRRFLERHPDLVLRRRARRALHCQRRTLRRAARAGDGPRFAATAISALRVACSPHYPAEPRALVGADVLAVLPPAERAGCPGETVRRFFTVADAAHYAEAPADVGGLLTLEPELERTLELLEAKL